MDMLPANKLKIHELTRHASFGDGKNNNKKSSSDQFVVVDLKATCWNRDDNKYGVSQEIIEFSSVLVDAATGHPMSSTFHEYVIPTEHHELSEFCKNYNGIKQEDVQRGNGAVTLSEALQLHEAWIQENNNGRGGGGGGGGGSGSGSGLDVNSSAAVVVVTWGNWDCRTMLKQECLRKDLRIP
ncbi:unnamed protein product [Miscanthus lutarioriparius]|uniref:Exonuclease domain-containing protein n=1 Tax=Miscanthus lutarioriparius TaxID=422564 RepID=A0A811N1B1_9POAL|nr:unnamed protein product [Miscanthus lutarioriparius]